MAATLEGISGTSGFCKISILLLLKLVKASLQLSATAPLTLQTSPAHRGARLTAHATCLLLQAVAAAQVPHALLMPMTVPLLMNLRIIGLNGQTCLTCHLSSGRGIKTARALNGSACWIQQVRCRIGFTATALGNGDASRIVLGEGGGGNQPHSDGFSILGDSAQSVCGARLAAHGQ